MAFRLATFIVCLLLAIPRNSILTSEGGQPKIIEETVAIAAP